MTAEESIDRLRGRLEANGKASSPIDVYLEGAKAKLRHARFALDRMGNIVQSARFVASCLVSLATTEAAAPDAPIYRVSGQKTSIANYDKLIGFYLDSFFAFAYSSLDVLAQVVNILSELKLDEKKVSFKDIKEKLQQKSPETQLGSLLSAITDRNQFKEVEAYRHCSTHRRQIFSDCREVQEKSIHTTAGYTDYTFNERAIQYQWYLCDDPSAIKPTTTKNRKVIEYCQDVLGYVEGAISEVVNELEL